MSIDYELANLVEIAIKLDEPIPVTLFTPGHVLVGDLVSVRRWYELQHDQHSSDPSDPDDDRLEWLDLGEKAQAKAVERLEHHRQFLESFPEGHTLTEEELIENDALEPSFVYLENVTVYLAANQTMRFPLWKGRLDSIVGWSPAASVSTES